MRKAIGVFAAMAMVVFAAPAQAGSAEGAKQFIDTVARQVLDVLKTDAPISDKKHKLVAIFRTKVDIPYVAKFVLGQHWRTASPAQQQSYVGAYGPFVLGNYASKLTRYSGQSYALKNSRADGDGAYVVTMQITDGNSAGALVDYRLKNSGEGYQLVDIVVEGVSLLATQRSEFNAIVQNKGLDHLIDQLKKSPAAS